AAGEGLYTFDSFLKLSAMRIKSNIATSEEGFVFNPGTGDSFSTNPSGSEIIMMLKKGKSIEEIFETISGKYDVDDLLLERDLEDFTSLLKDYGILE
ncbi:MAG: PqqD family protein, partial [Bacteroidales bacterium]|nr:PqqD family protein [Bacteroidales bacterium]